MTDERRIDDDPAAAEQRLHGDSLSLQPDSLHTEQSLSIAPLATTELTSERVLPVRLSPGDRCGEFEIVDLLGRGGFGMVYLARETSLDRLVALKISPNVGSEGRNLAQLEHENIVQVHSEKVDLLRHQRLLCMQYVPGMTLGKLFTLWREQGSRYRSGPGIIHLLDQNKSPHARFDPSALRDREVLEDCDSMEAVCLLISRLAAALAHAHERNILHLDIKPNNILLSQYGRPYLMDFNLSFQSVDLSATQPQPLGGTLPYMSPEHLEALLNRGDESTRQRLDVRTDAYGLGVVLFEMLEGRLPFALVTDVDAKQRVRRMIAQRREQSGTFRLTFQGAPGAMNCIVQRCLAGAPEQRFASALELQQELEGCRQLHHVQRSLPQSRWSLRYMLPHPWIWLVVIGLLPHLVGGFVQLSYNATRIVHQLSLPQQVLFPRMAIAFNPFLYSACLLWIVAYIVPVFRAWRRFQADPCDAGCDIDVARQQAIGLPAKAALVGSVGWLCSAIFFPSVLHWRAGALPWDAWIHFGISFLLAGSIAVAYGFILTQYVVLRIFYLEMWSSTRTFADRAGQELSGIEPRLRIFQWLAGAIPIMGAVVMVSVGPEKFSAGEYGTFRLFVTLLILSGMAGTRFATAIGRHVSALIRALSA